MNVDRRLREVGANDLVGKEEAFIDGLLLSGRT